MLSCHAPASPISRQLTLNPLAARFNEMCFPNSSSPPLLHLDASAQSELSAIEGKVEISGEIDVFSPASVSRAVTAEDVGFNHTC